jgi:hypothetical protein
LMMAKRLEGINTSDRMRKLARIPHWILLLFGPYLSNLKFVLFSLPLVKELHSAPDS